MYELQSLRIQDTVKKLKKEKVKIDGSALKKITLLEYPKRLENIQLKHRMKRIPKKNTMMVD